ncbi:MAG: hypothetical protein NTW86_28450, partial [Candidatus Sumerlaeota bacterium]|nr:hypothetical protein [Candidatus Sumerlaeota bacterium]
MNDQPDSGGLGCAYVGQYHLEQFRRDLEEIMRAGVRRLYLPMTEEDAELRRPNLEAMTALARDAAIEPWLVPWGVGGLFGGPRGTRFTAQHLDARQIDSAGESLPVACPNNPLFLRYMENWIHQAAEAGAQAILWDEPWWARHSVLPGYRDMDTARLWACCCEHCRRRFRSLYRSETMPEEIDADVRDFRSRVLGSFLRELGEA